MTAILIGFAVVLALVVLLGVLTTPTYQERLIRERRRHAEETARVIQQMAAIRNRTIARMDEAERSSNHD